MAPKPLDVEVRAVGVDGVRRQIRLVGDEAGNVQEKYGQAGERVAGVLAMIAHHGELSTREMKELVREGAEMATMFGAGGAILGGVTLLGVAFGEAFSKGNEAMHKMLELLGELDAELVKLNAEAKGNKLGVKEQDLNAAYIKKIQEIQKDAPGVFSRAWAEVLAGIGAISGSEGFFKDSFNAYAGRQMAQAIAIREEGAIRLKQEAIGKGEVDAEAKRQADEAAKKLEEARKHAFESAAYLAANDLSANDNFIRILAPAWTQMWQRFSLDATIQKDTTAINRGMIERTITDAMGEVGNVGKSGITSALAGLDALRRQGPLLGSFSSSFAKQLKDITDASTNLDESLGALAGSSIPALASGFEAMFGAIGSGQPVFKAFAHVAIDSIAQVAAKMAAQEFAEGLAMVARSIWDFFGPNPAAGVSAAKHFEAAAVFGSIAAGASLAAGATGGSGGGGGGSFGGPSFQSAPPASTKGPITIYMPPTGMVVDPNNKSSVDAFLDFVQQLDQTRQISIVVR